MDLKNLDSSSKVLLAGNILSIILAIAFGFNLSAMVWVYWFESVSIGVFTFFRLFLTASIAEAKQKIGTYFMAFFFIFHYGFFHFVYFIFLTALEWFALDPGEYVYLLITCSVLFLVHLFSFYVNFMKKSRSGEKNSTDAAKDLFIAPYARIVPMHLTIILSGFVMVFFPVKDHLAMAILLVIFMGFKTIMDLQAHMGKNRIDINA